MGTWIWSYDSFFRDYGVNWRYTVWHCKSENGRVEVARKTIDTHSPKKLIEVIIIVGYELLGSLFSYT